MFKYFDVFHEGDDSTLFLTDKIGQNLKQFLHFPGVLKRMALKYPLKIKSP